MADILVLGAGMVGVATALALQERGYEVALVDRAAPGSETSYGNAGIIQSEAAEPYAFPRQIGMILDFLLRRSNDVHCHWAALPSQFQPLASYFANSRRKQHLRISSTYAQLTRAATDDHAAWIAASGAEDLINRDGYRLIYRTERKLSEAIAFAGRMTQTYGVRSRVLTSRELTIAEPGMLQSVAGAVQWLDPWSCRNPAQLVTAYSKLFASRGGLIEVGDASTLVQHDQQWRVQIRAGYLSAQHVVVALGPWSPSLMSTLGYRVPMFRKRGYHRHFEVSNGPQLPFMDAERGAFCSPMQLGLRICSGAEIAKMDAPITPVQIERAEKSVRSLFALGRPLDSRPWIGYRPCMPDMLPVVGPAMRHRNLWVNFGHGHQGFTLGPTTGRLLATQVAGEQSATDVMSALRFGRWRS